MSDRIAQVNRLTQADTEIIKGWADDHIALAMVAVAGRATAAGYAPEQTQRIIREAAIRWGWAGLERAEILTDHLNTETKNWTRPEVDEGDPDEVLP